MTDTPMEKANEREDGMIEIVAEGFEKPLLAQSPREDQLGFVMARMTKRKAGYKEMATVINYVVDIFDEESADAIADRMMDDEDDFGLEDLIELFGDLVEAWSARPTKRPSDFTPSQKQGGKKSTARASARASTSQRSRQTAS